MTLPNHHAQAIIDRVLQGRSREDAVQRLSPRLPVTEPLPERLKSFTDHSVVALHKRRELLASLGICTTQLAGEGPEIEPEQLAGNIENQVGMARIPVGVVGPLRVNGSAAHGDFYVPMATTEGALVASYHRGAMLVSQAGGATAICLTEILTRAPVFQFESVRDVGLFLAWLLPEFPQLQAIVGQTTAHGKLRDVQTSIVGKEVFLLFEYTTGDASGQNMVTVATQALCQWIVENSPVVPQHWFIDGNMSGDKKATVQAFSYARGKKVVAESVLPALLVRRILNTTPEQIVRYAALSAIGGIQSGSIGVQGHYANGLAAVFLACGQDVACVSEAAVGLTRMDITKEGDLYVSVSVPNLICGTVGGGTSMPTAKECLTMLGCAGAGHARKLAEIFAALLLCGEISITGAMAAGEFAAAHQKHGRKSTAGGGNPS
ncbi:MAG: hydroxymethylglutaryl-CoA reductase [Planctomycetaceae bacterium]|nr:hydroxymethylglutaryl-CoA reductase [Planctomycetaceae bacterium]